jgi:hypothetical protein
MRCGKLSPGYSAHRADLEHIIRAATGITGSSDFTVVGIQAVLGQFPNAPEELLISMEADVFSLRNPADNDLIDGSIGEGSQFGESLGFWCQPESLASLPRPVFRSYFYLSSPQ